MISNYNFGTNMEYYKVFYYVVKLKNITLAAERMALTQPSVTKTIKKLEEDLKCQLLVRTNRGVTLTPEGKALWARIEAAFDMIIAAEQEIKSAQPLDGGVIRIASSEMNFSVYVLPALKLFLNMYPKVKVKMHAQGTAPKQTLDMLKAGMIDLAVLSPLFDPDGALEYRTIDIYPQVPVAGPRYSGMAGHEHTLRELLQYPIIAMPEGYPGRTNLEEHFRDNGLVLTPSVEVYSIEHMLQAASENLGVAIVPLRIAEQRIEDGSLFRLRVKTMLPERRALAITNRSIALNKATRIFMEEFLLKQAFHKGMSAHDK